MGMAAQGELSEDLRDKVLANPALVLDDDEVMQALVAAHDAALGSNVVDLRQIAIDRLEMRLAQLNDTHRSVIAAAYDNVAGTNMVHRAVLLLVGCASLAEFCTALAGPMSDMLRIDTVRLVIETEDPGALVCDGVLAVRPGFVADYMGAARRNVVLRATTATALVVHDGAPVASEALMRLDLGAEGGVAMLSLGANDPEQFQPGQGTDLLAFLAGVTGQLLARLVA